MREVSSERTVLSCVEKGISHLMVIYFVSFSSHSIVGSRVFASPNE